MADTPLRTKKRRETRSAILDACAAELAVRAEESITMDDIAGRAVVSRATVFNYFPTKRDIIVGIANREIDELQRVVEERNKADASPLETVAEVMYRLVGFSFSEPVTSWRVLRSLFDDPAREELPVRRLLRIIERLVEEAQAEGMLRTGLDPAGCARAIVGTYFAELFVIAGSGERGTIERLAFDEVAEQLVSDWRTPRADGPSDA